MTHARKGTGNEGAGMGTRELNFNFSSFSQLTDVTREAGAL